MPVANVKPANSQRRRRADSLIPSPIRESVVIALASAELFFAGIPCGLEPIAVEGDREADGILRLPGGGAFAKKVTSSPASRSLQLDVRSKFREELTIWTPTHAASALAWDIVGLLHFAI